MTDLQFSELREMLAAAAVVLSFAVGYLGGNAP